MASPNKNNGFNPWMQMAGLQGNNIIPLQQGQMVAQASQDEFGNFPFQETEQSQMPQIMSPPAQNIKLSTQPIRQPLGTIPQEIIPKQIGPAPVRKLSLAEEIDLSQQNYGKGLALSQAEIDKMKEGLSRYTKSESGVDFTPLAALLDTWYGGNLTQSARAMAPETEAQKQKNIIDMQGKISQAQRGMSDLEREGIQQRLSQLGYEEQRKSAKEIARINAETRKTGVMQDRLAQQKADRIETDVQKLEKRIGDLTPGIITKLKNLEKIVPGGIEGSEDIDVPGVGPAMFAVPDIALGSEASDIQSNARGLASDLIKLQSGTAASDQEVSRKMKELGMSPGSKVSTFRSGLKRLKNQIKIELKNKESGFRPEVKETYKTRGGLTHESIDEIGNSPIGGDDDVNADLDKMTTEQLNNWLMKHGGQ